MFILFVAAGFIRNERHQRRPGGHDVAESGSAGAPTGSSGGGWWGEKQGLQTHHTEFHQVHWGHPRQ